MSVSLQQEIATNFEQIFLGQGDYLFRQGDAGDDGMYIIIKGYLRALVTQPDGSQIVVDEHKTGGFLGEIAMLTGSKRTASIVAVTKTEVARLSKTVFDRLAKENPQIVSQISQIVLQRLRRPQLFSTLSNIFGPLDLHTFEDIQTELTWLHLTRGTQLIQQGDMNDDLYLLISGRLQAVAVDEAGDEQVVGEIIAGESVGEMQILTGEARSASVYAIRDCELVKLSKAGFDRLVDKRPELLRHITQLVIKRLQNTMQTSSKYKPNLALDIVLVPASPDVPLVDFSRQLAKALNKYGSILVLNSERFDSYLGVPGAAQSPVDDPDDIRVAVGLNEQTTQYNFRLYETDSFATPWTNRCLRQADQVLIVGNAEADPQLSQVELEMLAEEHKLANVRKRLILLHAPTTQNPLGSAKWLALRQLHNHHHIRRGHTADYNSLARILTGRAVGLVLGSGGARGMAHIGVIRAIEEAGLEIDAVGGTSFGSLVGAFYALGYDYDYMVEQAKQLSNTKLIYDYTIPLTSFLAGKKFAKLLQQLFGDLQIEDTWRKYFGIASNLTTANQMIYQQGPLWQCVRASSSMPLIFPPACVDGEVMVDGGLINSLPLDVMRDRCEGGTVIGVDVSLGYDLTDTYQIEGGISGWKILESRLNPFKENIKAPTLLSLFTRAVGVNSVYRREAQSELADLYIHPPVEQFATLAWEAYDEIIDIGYRTAQQQLEAWLAKQPL